MPKVGYARDPELEKNYPTEWPAWARVLLKDGREVSTYVRFPKGDPENPLSWEELVEKYQTLTRAVWEREKVDRVQSAVRQLEHETNLGDFTILL